jgi:hypothetical protein
MTKQELAPVFDEIKEDYLKQILANWDDIDLEALGLVRGKDGIEVPFYNRRYLVSPDGIKGGESHILGHMTYVTISQYLLGPAKKATGPVDWASFKEFPDGAPYGGGFQDVVERKLAQVFSGRLEELRKRCEELGGFQPEKDYSYDLVQCFQALPKVPVLLLFNDEEDMFPAQCSVLFQSDCAGYLDMESVVMVGTSLMVFLTGGDSMTA